MGSNFAQMSFMGSPLLDENEFTYSNLTKIRTFQELKHILLNIFYGVNVHLQQ